MKKALTAAILCLAAAAPAADLADVPYGPHARNVMDVWKAPSKEPAPLLIYFHGGGFRGGSKASLPAGLVRHCLAGGVSVASANYRLSPAVAFPDHYLDGARAIQFARHSAKEWNVDPDRIVLAGSSAGGGMALWIAFHDDLADPASADPVLRQSTRVRGVLALSAQSTYDPRVVRQILGEKTAQHSALRSFYGLAADELDSEKAHRLYEQASPVNLLTADDPPVFALYSESKAPVPADAAPGAGIHHPAFGVYLKEKMDALQVPCVVRHREEGAAVAAAQREFVERVLARR